MIQKLHLTNGISVINYDTYYDQDDILESHEINVRRRIAEGNLVYTIKKKTNPDSSISDRMEYHFDSISDVTLFLQKEWKLPIDSLKERVHLKTSRTSYSWKYQDTLFEISFDDTHPSFEGVYHQPFFMIECEFKEGDSSLLSDINQILLDFEFLENCKMSKKEIALENEMPVRQDNPFDKKIDVKRYEQQISTYFTHSMELLNRLKLLNDKKEQVKQLKEEFGSLETPIVVTINGTPRAGKTTCIDNLLEFLRKSDLQTVCLEEPAGLVYQTLKSREEKMQLLKDRVGFVEKQFDIGDEYIRKNLVGNDILLCDRGVLDTFTWYDMYYKLDMISQEQYVSFLSRMKTLSSYYNRLYSLYTSSYTSMIRDYQNSLSIEARSTMNEDNVKRYNNALLRMLPVYQKHIDYVQFINTTELDRMDASIFVADDILDYVLQLYRRK